MVQLYYIHAIVSPIGYNIGLTLNNIAQYIKEKRKQFNLTQQELAIKAGVGLRFIRDLEQGKTTVRTDKVNKVLKLFGNELGPVPLSRRGQLNEKG